MAALVMMEPAFAGLRIPFATWGHTYSRGVVPTGWPKFCRDYADQCRPGDPSRAQLGAKEWRAVLAINTAVNSSVVQITDQEHWGEPERWDLPTDGRGDCEDLALEKRRRLVQAGFPAGSLLVTVVRDRQGDGHAVLTLTSTRGDFVLDNLTDRVKPWQKTPYAFDRRQSAVDPSIWLAMWPYDPQTTVTATERR